jgi:hypothetical protein
MQKLAPMRRRVNQLIHIQDSISLPADEQQACKEEQRALAKEKLERAHLWWLKRIQMMVYLS